MAWDDAGIEIAVIAGRASTEQGCQAASSPPFSPPCRLDPACLSHFGKRRAYRFQRRETP
jgi:hypothetical protein